MGNYEGEEVFTPFKSLLPMVDLNELVLGGWDISGLNMAEAMERAKVGRAWQQRRALGASMCSSGRAARTPSVSSAVTCSLQCMSCQEQQHHTDAVLTSKFSNGACGLCLISAWGAD